jgi:DNA polymerase-3 subunit delta'
MDWGIIGHNWAVDLLAEHIARRQERHAYLITGPRGVGRRTLALRFAQGLNCERPPSPGQPCLDCKTCQRIGAMQHPDLSVVQAEHEGEVLRIDQVRDLQHSLALAPYEARYRVALLLRFEEAHASAANAMLKTLEEPPAQVVVLLTAMSAESLLPTIVSRCEVIRLRPLSLEDTSQGLQEVKHLPAETANQLAHISAGRPGYALRLYTQPHLLEQRVVYIEEQFQLLSSSLHQRFAFVAERMNARDELRDELQVWITLWRDALIYASSLAGSITNIDYADQLQQLAGSISLDAALRYIMAIERTIDRIDHNVNTRLALEVLVMDLPRVSRINLAL